MFVISSHFWDLGKEQRKFTSSHPKVSKYAELLKTLNNFVIIKRDSL